MADNLSTVVSSASQTVKVNGDRPTAIIDERISPTGRKKVLAALREGTLKRCAKTPRLRLPQAQRSWA